MKMSLPDYNFWSGKRVLITGHTGFKGGWLTLWLSRLGAQVSGIGLRPNTNPNLFELAKIEELCDSYFCDICNREALGKIIKNLKPEFVFHLAAQPLVRQSYMEPVETFYTNVIGTAHILDALRGLDCIKSIVIITSDKVYQNRERQKPYHENDVLGGHDPYSASKAASEILISSYRDSFLAEQGVSVACARAGNVIGGGDWCKDRLIPDAVRAWQKGVSVEIRRPNSVRPWQHILDPLFGYIILAEKLSTNINMFNAFNFGPENQEAAPVKFVIELARKAYGSGTVLNSKKTKGPHEAGLLTLDISRAQQTLGYSPRLKLFDAIKLTMNWYRSQYSGLNPRELCYNDISFYEALQ